MTEAIVAGHICLDIIPKFPPHGRRLEPGQLIQMGGPATISTGGAVSNTGRALHRLGISTRLLGKIGDDWVGRLILDSLGPELATDMIIVKGEISSHTVVINPPGSDRMFLYYPGANDTFTAADLADRNIAGAKLFHFGYPTLMQYFYNDGGTAMEEIFRRAKIAGATTSLDMSYPDPDSAAGRINWTTWLQRVLPQVDIFLPSLDEMQSMLHTPAAPADLARQLCDWGAKIAGLKMGNRGLHVRWNNRELHAPCFQVQVAGTTGAGDATIAGFLAGILRGLAPEETMTLAAAVGACCCEAPDATSGIRSWNDTWHRIHAGWKTL